MDHQQEDDPMDDKPETSGVQQLIDRLSREGVAEGEQQAEQLLAAAREKATEIIEAAKGQAGEIVDKARQEADHFRVGGEEALKLACRDGVRDLASRLHEGFRGRLQELVKHHLQDTDLLKQMILEIAGKAKPPEGAEVQVLLPPEAIGEEELKKRIKAGDEDALTQFAADMLGDEIRKGFTLQPGDSEQTGLRVRVVDENVEIDFTDEAITQLLAQHLLPRFRAVLRS
jgi:V/A-type H+-transporting ATPase subunit E